MKKCLASISFLCYFIVTSGVVVNYHYCMKKLVSVRLFEKKANICGLCGMNMHKGEGCCKDEVKIAKLVMDQSSGPQLSFEPPLLETTTIIPSGFIAASFYSINGKLHFHNHSPPLLSAQDTYLQNNVFRI